MVKDLKRASIYKFKKECKLLIYSVSKVQVGSMATEPYIWVDAKSTEEIAKSLLYALDCSSMDFPTPLDSKLAEKNFIASIGLKNLKELNDNTINVSVMKQDGKITFKPMKNLSPRKGFVNVNTDPIIIPADSTLLEISAALEKAFKKCE